jgi:lauroyl/myristoyl acyltransferase
MSATPANPSFSTSHRPAFRPALLAPRFWGIWIGFAGLWLLRLVPAVVRAALADALAAATLRVPSKRRSDGLANLRACFPAMGDGERRALLRRHARIQYEVYLALGELMFARRDRLLARFDVSGIEALERASASGTGVMILAPHTCAFEWAAQCAAMLHPLVSMARLHKDNPALDWIVNRMRVRSGGVVYGNEQSMVPLVKAVRAGERWLFYLPDEDRKNANGVFVPFFGRPKLTIPSMGRLATACRAAVFPLRVCYQPERRRIRLEFLPPLADFPTGDPTEDARRMNAAIEEILAPDPAQYAWTQRIFRSRPPGVASIY